MAANNWLVSQTLAQLGFTNSLPIQQAICKVFAKTKSLVIHGPVAAGKTTGICVLLAQELKRQQPVCEVVIVARSAEMAAFIQAIFETMWLNCRVYCASDNIDTLAGCKIIVGIVGDITKLLANSEFSKSKVHTLFIDDADEILNQPNNGLEKLHKHFKKRILVTTKSFGNLSVFRSIYVVKHPCDFNSVTNLTEMNIFQDLLKRLTELGYLQPPLLHQHALLPCLQGQSMILEAPAAAGKTTSVCVTVLHRLQVDKDECQAIIVTSSNESTSKIANVLSAMSKYLPCKVLVCQNMQLNSNLEKYQVVVGMPYQIENALKRIKISQQPFKMLVLELENNMRTQIWSESHKSIIEMLGSIEQIIVTCTNLPKLPNFPDVSLFKATENGVVKYVETSYHTITIFENPPLEMVVTDQVPVIWFGSSDHSWVTFQQNQNFVVITPSTKVLDHLSQQLSTATINKFWCEQKLPSVNYESLRNNCQISTGTLDEVDTLLSSMKSQLERMLFVVVKDTFFLDIKKKIKRKVLTSKEKKQLLIENMYENVSTLIINGESMHLEINDVIDLKAIALAVLQCIDTTTPSYQVIIVVDSKTSIQNFKKNFNLDAASKPITEHVNILIDTLKQVNACLTEGLIQPQLVKTLIYHSDSFLRKERVGALINLKSCFSKNLQIIISSKGYYDRREMTSVIGGSGKIIAANGVVKSYFLEKTNKIPDNVPIEPKKSFECTERLNLLGIPKLSLTVQRFVPDPSVPLTTPTESCILFLPKVERAKFGKHSHAVLITQSAGMAAQFHRLLIYKAAEAVFYCSDQMLQNTVKSEDLSRNHDIFVGTIDWIEEFLETPLFFTNRIMVFQVHNAVFQHLKALSQCDITESDGQSLTDDASCLQLEQTVLAPTVSASIDASAPTQNDSVLEAFLKSGYTTPTLVQERALPPLFEGKSVLITAPHGSGKRLAMCLSALRMVNPQLQHCQVLIIVNFFKEARQIYFLLQQLSYNTDCRTYLRSDVKKPVESCHIAVVSIQFGVKWLLNNPGMFEGLKIVALHDADVLWEMAEICVSKILDLVPSDVQHIALTTRTPECLDSYISKNIKVTLDFINQIADPIEVVAEQLQPPIEVEKTVAKPVIDHFKTSNINLDQLLKFFANETIVVWCKDSTTVAKLFDSFQEDDTVAKVYRDNTSRENQINVNQFRFGYAKTLIVADDSVGSRERIILGITAGVLINYNFSKSQKKYYRRLQIVRPDGKVVNFVTPKTLAQLTSFESALKLNIKELNI